MILDHSFPREAERAQRENIPLVIPAGTVEYHGPHCSYGCDTLVAEGLIKELMKTKEIMLAPTISYSPSSYAVGDDKSGTVHVEERAFENYVYYVFMSLLSAGYRNIYVVIHHQFEQESEMFGCVLGRDRALATKRREAGRTACLSRPWHRYILPPHLPDLLSGLQHHLFHDL